ncbi:MAG: 1-phosphofructokinase family hexose kinase [Oscillospiraceae bacterium]|nr:1-phosphofructokinase family hexose kinase [Oscillospiraceae bacterium]
MHKSIICITLNPSIDVTLWTDSLHYDKTNRIVYETRGVGGKGINVSRVAHSFGMQTLCLSVAGKDNCSEFAGYLNQENLKYELIKIDGAVRENLTLRCGEQTIKLNRKGPELSAMMINALMELIKCRVSAGDIVVFAGSLPVGFPKEYYIELILAVKNIGALVAIDSDFLNFEDYNKISPWLIKPNIHELRSIVSVKGDSVNDIADSAHILCSSGVQNVLTSLGGSGMVFVSNNKRIRAVVPKVDVKSTVGSGDSSLAGFIIGYIKGNAAIDCVRLAAACGTACAMKDGTMLADRESALKILDDIVLSEF